MSAAMEASIEKIPAIGFSYLDYSFDADFSLIATSGQLKYHPCHDDKAKYPNTVYIM
jgi:hypothetical protein